MAADVCVCVSQRLIGHFAIVTVRTFSTAAAAVVVVDAWALCVRRRRVNWANKIARFTPPQIQAATLLCSTLIWPPSACFMAKALLVICTSE